MVDCSDTIEMGERN